MRSTGARSAGKSPQVTVSGREGTKWSGSLGAGAAVAKPIKKSVGASTSAATVQGGPPPLLPIE
jgi:hypothetical protein